MTVHHDAKWDAILSNQKKQRQQICLDRYSSTGSDSTFSSDWSTIQISFSKAIQTIPTVVCSFGGYGSPGENWTDTQAASWGGCAFISAMGI